MRLGANFRSLVVGLSFVFGTAIAACPNPGLIVLYFNGVWNTLGGAYDSVAHLTDVVGDTAANGAPIEVVLMFNPSEGTFPDIFESYRQKISDLNAVNAIDLASQNLLMAAFYFDWQAYRYWTTDFPSPNAKQIADVTEQQRIAAEARAMQATPEVGVVDGMYARAAGFLDQNYRLLFVAHSQGNLFARDVYQRLSDSQKLLVSAVNVASPDSHPTIVNGLHITATTDLVMAAVPTAMAPTTSTVDGIACIRRDWSGHHFVETYLDSSCAGAPVRDAIRAERNRLQPVSLAYSPDCAFEFKTRIVSNLPSGSVFDCASRDGSLLGFQLQGSYEQCQADAYVEVSCVGACAGRFFFNRDDITQSATITRYFTGDTENTSCGEGTMTTGPVGPATYSPGSNRWLPAAAPFIAAALTPRNGASFVRNVNVSLNPAYTNNQHLSVCAASAVSYGVAVRVYDTQTEKYIDIPTSLSAPSGP